MHAKISKSYLEFNPYSCGSNTKGQKFYLMSLKRGPYQKKLGFDKNDAIFYPTSIEVDGHTYNRKSLQVGPYLVDHGGFYRRVDEDKVIDIWVPYATEEMLAAQFLESRNAEKN